MEEETIRILHVFNNLGQGGIQNFIMNVYRNIDRNKVQFDFLMNDNGFFDEEVKSLGGKIYKIDSLNKSGQIKYVKKLKKFFNEHKEYKIVHSHYNQVSGIILEVAKKCNIPVRIAHSHSIGNSNNIIAKIYKKYLQSKINKNATHLFACSEDAAKWLFKDKYKETVIVNNGIDIEKFKFSEEKRRKIRQELNINADTMVIGHIGRFSKVKNHEFIINIFNEYLKINSNSVLILVGTGELEQNIKEKVKKINIKDKVKFLGVRKDTDYLYSAFDCFISPSRYEGLGITLIEAQDSGLQTITSADVVPIETKVTELIKYISLKENASIWAEHIKDLNNIDRKSINDKLIDSKYSINKTVSQLQRFYEEVI